MHKNATRQVLQIRPTTIINCMHYLYSTNIDMEDPPYEIKTLIHHVIHRHNVYKLEIQQIRQILQLLQQTSTEEPLDIQHKIFTGILLFNHLHKDNISSTLSEDRFRQISFDTKSLMHKILHEFNFLNSIKAWEMFLQQYQQPGTLTQNNLNNPHQQLLDDQLEKAKLHYLYYGPMSVYHFSHQQMPLAPQPMMENYPPPMPPSQPMPMPAPFDYGREKKPQLEHVMPRPRGRPPGSTKNAKAVVQTSSPLKIKLKPEVYKSIVQTKQKKPIPEKVSAKQFLAQNQKLLGDKMDLQIPQNQFSECLCQGQNKNQKAFQCKCSKMFHPQCVRHPKECLACRQAQFDPFVKVNSLIATYVVDLRKGNLFEDQVNLIGAWNASKLKKYEIMISCACPFYQGVTWPDDIIFKINDQPIFQIPALLQTYQISKRKDRAFIITPYIASFANANPSYLQRMKLTLEVKKYDDNLTRRNNRNQVFQLCLFLVKEVTPGELVKDIIEQNCSIPNMGPFEWSFHGQIEVEKFSVSFFDTFSGQIMQHPVRGVNCKHYQCFQMNNFLQLMYTSSSRQWRCPYCQKDARKLMIDKYQLSLIEQLRKGELFPSKLIFFRNGTIDYVYKQTTHLQQENYNKTD